MGTLPVVRGAGRLLWVGALLWALLGCGGTAETPAGATPAVLAPGAPGTLAATGGVGVVDLVWSAPATGGAPTGYKVYRSTTATVSTAGTPLATEAAVSHADTTAASGTTYYYRVVAANAAGGSPDSNEASAVWVPPVVAGGASHSVLLKADSTLWGWGNNLSGQLGDGSYLTRTTPVAVLTPAGAAPGTVWATVAAGGAHTAALRSDGTLWGWGDNGYGQVGDPDFIYYTTPVQIDPAQTWKTLAAGYQHTLAIRSDDTLWAWGRNNYGQLGIGSTNTVANATPVQVAAVGTGLWQAIAGNQYHSLGIQSDGTLWAWGFNDYGQLGTGVLGDGVNPITPVPTPTLISSAAWSAVSVGFKHSLGLRADGSLWAWGDNGSGQVGDGAAAITNLDFKTSPVDIGSGPFKAVRAGFNHSLALDTTGVIWVWGYPWYGQLGDGTPLGTNTPHALPVTMDGATDWAQIGAGEHHTLAFKTNGSAYVWGRNDSDQLGLDALRVNRIVPTLLTLPAVP